MNQVAHGTRIKPGPYLPVEPTLIVRSHTHNKETVIRVHHCSEDLYPFVRSRGGLYKPLGVQRLAERYGVTFDGALDRGVGRRPFLPALGRSF